MSDKASSEVEPIDPAAARAILDAAIAARIGEHWQEPDSSWKLVTGHDFMARFTNGHQVVDFYVDLLGEVRIEESTNTELMSLGHMRAWMILIASLLVVFTIARLTGFI